MGKRREGGNEEKKRKKKETMINGVTTLMGERNDEKEGRKEIKGRTEVIRKGRGRK